MFFVVTEEYPNDGVYIETDNDNVGGVFCDYMIADNFLAHPYNGAMERRLYEAKFVNGRLQMAKLMATVRWNGQRYTRVDV